MINIEEIKEEFKKNHYTLLVINDEEVIVRSNEKGVTSLVRLIDSKMPYSNSIFFINSCGKAVAFCLTLLNCKEAYITEITPEAEEILTKNSTKVHYFSKINQISRFKDYEMYELDKEIYDIIDPLIALEKIKQKLYK